MVQEVMAPMLAVRKATSLRGWADASASLWATACLNKQVRLHSD